ncbi:MAG: FAD-dependent oxidoreductase [Lentisphaerae bacterium]|jgi:hypothetical protein|nr:FAD-dependent oxidoreductase [Lentisphaerota bacterium]
MNSYSIIVFGAGPSGICAAIHASNCGLSTLLVEPSSVAGGAITLAGVAVPALFNAWGRQVIAGIGWELVKNTLLEMGEKLPDFMVQDTSDHVKNAIKINPLIFSAIADEALLNAKVNIAYHTMPATLDWNGSSWDVGLCTKDGLVQVRASVIIDCTGDANATKIAGYQVLSPDYCQPGTFSFHATGYQFDQIDFNELANDFYTAIQNGTLKLEDVGWATTAPPDNPNWVKSFFWHFFGRQGKNTNHISWINAYSSERKTQMDIEGRASALRLFRFLKGRKGLENLTFNQIAQQTGARETRRIVGETTVTEDDYTSGRIFPDAICYSFYPIDLHDPKCGLIVKPLKPGIVPTVPRGALIPKNSANFLAAGRIISSERAANSALRIQATCMATGQAAGAIAAMAVKLNQQPREIPIQAIHDSLRKQNAIVPSIP